MGGYGSGRRYGSKSTTGEYLQLDVRRLQRDGLLERRFAFNWQWSRHGDPVGNINLRPEEDRIVLSYRHQRAGQDWESKEYPVQLERTSCHYGGERAWFLCPARGCRRRVAILYGGGIFACRDCYCLAYESQTESPAYRALSRTQNIRVRLGGSGSLAEDFPNKPKGMHWKSYLRLLHKANLYEQISNEAMMSWIGAQRARTC
jgi:hypothetical protein